MRYKRIDEIRGLTLISMILYHFLWDLIYIAGFKIPWYEKWQGNLWQKSICITFIFLSGFTMNVGRHHFKRGITISMCGLIITLATLLFMPSNRVVFGILTFTGAAMLFMAVCIWAFNKLKKHIFKNRQNEKDDKKTINCVNITNCNYIFVLCLSVFLYIMLCKVNSGEICLLTNSVRVSEKIYANLFTTFLGFPMKGFYSTDYFSFFPWIFIFIAGYFFFKVFKNINEKFMNKILSSQTIPYVDILGRHSLKIYMFHQIILYLITIIIMKVERI